MPALSQLAFHAVLVLSGVWVAMGGTQVLAAATLVLGAGLLLLVRASRSSGEAEPETSEASPLAASFRGRAPWITGALLGLAVLSGLAGELHLNRVTETWDAQAEDRERSVREALADRLDRLLSRGEDAAYRLAALEAGEGGGPVRRLPPDLLGADVDAVALFGPGGELLAWEGSHQGPVPRSARLGLSPYLYEESALFGYLYVTRPLPGGTGTAVAASLLRADLPATLEDDSADFVSRFRAETGERIQVGREDRVEGEVAWGLTWEREILFSVAVLPQSQAEVRSRIQVRWGWLVVLLLAVSWTLLARGSRDTPGARRVSVASLLLLVLALPVGRLAGSGRLFSPADLLLPGLRDLTPGDLLVLAGVSVFLLGYTAARRGAPPAHPLRRPDRNPATPGFALAGGIGALALLLTLLREGASRDLLAGSEPLWALFVGGAFLAASAVLAVVVHLGRRPTGSLHPSWLLAAVAGTLLLGALASWGVREAGGFPTVLLLFWALPVVALLLAFGGGDGWGEGAIRWASVGVVAATLVLPWGWGARVEARIADAEDRIERLGTRPDPFLEFLLIRSGEEARELSGLDRNPVEVLYGAWAGSGLAREGVPLWLTWWSPDGFAQEELRIGVATPRPSFPPDLRMRALIGDEVQLIRSELPDAHYVLAAPLTRGAVLTAVVPPRRGFAGDSPLGPLFSPARSDPDPVSLIPLLPGEAGFQGAMSALSGGSAAPGAGAAGEAGGVRWTLGSEGWRGETAMAFPDLVYRVQYAVTLPRPALVLARGSLLLLALVGGLLLVWGCGHRLATPTRIPFRRVGSGLSSFRGRVTIALFAFFLIPTILFGMLAYRTLSSASVRTAEALAARAAEDAAAGFADTGGAMDLLASRVGSDLLVYEGGQLVGGSQRELVELGLYQGWLPPSIHRTIESGSEVLVTTTASLGGWDYVVAYRRMPGGLVLAAPAALQAGATAVRQREVAELLAFTLLVGAGLSVLLALLVGRTLARPIQTLQVASERVGSGNMGVHLPANRTDEFGAVFGAFNRMVDRLARTRRALVRSSRRTRAIVEEVAAGVVAVDAAGRVTLANPRAERLLGSPLPRGEVIWVEEGGEAAEGAVVHPVRREIGRWVGEFMRDAVTEATAEFTVSGRRIRLRARRIGGGGGPSGAVVALEDVTDELRAERILAWGEMAQQVAHEVKNPLTPIKLGIQHIRRAWQDGSPDYDRILERNVQAILDEIDRLAAISTSFSRFAAPGPAESGPLEAVELERVVREVMVLYAAGHGAVEFRSSLPSDLPPVLARSDELKEVLVNLLENARSALPGGGHVVVRARIRPDGVELEVEDTGTGIAPEFHTRIFEPHFSTRTAGTGLGLAIVRRLVESWGGQIRVRSAVGEGTTMTLHLRNAPEPCGAPPAGSGPDPEGASREASEGEPSGASGNGRKEVWGTAPEALTPSATPSASGLETPREARPGSGAGGRERGEEGVP
jgi:two-component system nitrogen regulation sensor histidine kinase NtrY